MHELLLSGMAEFSQIICKQILDGSIDTAPSTILRYDRLLHELLHFLDSAFEIKSVGFLLRVQQLVALLLAESKGEAQELVEEWKGSEEGCALRAGEILLITNKLP